MQYVLSNEKYLVCHVEAFERNSQSKFSLNMFVDATLEIPSYSPKYAQKVVLMVTFEVTTSNISSPHPFGHLHFLFSEVVAFCYDLQKGNLFSFIIILPSSPIF